MSQQRQNTTFTKSGGVITSTNATGTFAHFQPYARSKTPALALTSLCESLARFTVSNELLNALVALVVVALSSLVPPAALPPHTYCPPYLHRVGFSLAFGVATWAFVAGDARNGGGIATAWSLIYLGFHARKSLRAPRHPLPLALTAGATGCAALYGTEYFLYQS